MGNRRVWFFCGLVAVAAGLMMTSAITPWWTCTIDIPEGESVVPKLLHVGIYEYGLQHDLVELRSYIEADETPFYQTVLAWVYIAASVGLILFSTWLKGSKGRWLLGGIGLVYIAYAAIAAFVVIANRTADFGISLQGQSIIPETVNVLVHASLRFGYYLAYAAGGMCIVLALLRNKIIGKPKPGA